MVEQRVELVLPWPPSANHYKGTQVILPPAGAVAAAFARQSPAEAWRWLKSATRASWYVKREGNQYYDAVKLVRMTRWHGGPLECALSVDIALHPPDRRVRDSDNVLKCICDSLEKAGMVKNDNQFEEIRVRRLGPVPGGRVVVMIQPMEIQLDLEAV